MKIYRPLWNEGALLSPQQFQQQAEWESFLSAGASALASPFPWGVEKIEFNDSLLSSGLIQITQLRLWLEDGSLIDAQRSDLPPAPRELDASLLAGRDAVTVVIALPHMQQGVANVEQEGVTPDRPLRYREEWVTLQDAFGSEEESMAVARFNFTIRFAHESNDSWKVCPVARLIRDGQNAWRQDPSFIPPVASFGASPVLRERLVLLNRQLRSRRQRLMTMRRESNERLADFAVADVSLFWLLNALNSHARVLTEYERFPSRPPEQVWAELARLAGSMLTFSLDHDLDAIPDYDHEEPANAFPPLFDLITGLLEASLPSRVIALEMSRPDGQTWKANLHDIRLREEADLYLSVRSDAGVHFELMARPSRDVARVQLTLDEQNLDYFNQMESWQSFTWPGNTYYPGVSLSWRSVNSGMQLYASNQGNWGFIRLLDKALITPLDASRTQLVWITADGNPLKFVMRSELGDGPLALLKLQGFTLPASIFNVAAGTEGVE